MNEKTTSEIPTIDAFLFHERPDLAWPEIAKVYKVTVQPFSNLRDCMSMLESDLASYTWSLERYPGGYRCQMGVDWQVCENAHTPEDAIIRALVSYAIWSGLAKDQS